MNCTQKEIGKMNYVEKSKLTQVGKVGCEVILSYFTIAENIGKELDINLSLKNKIEIIKLIQNEVIARNIFNNLTDITDELKAIRG